MSLFGRVAAGFAGRVVLNVSRRIVREHKLKKAAYLEGYADALKGRESKYD